MSRKFVGALGLGMLVVISPGCGGPPPEPVEPPFTELPPDSIVDGYGSSSPPSRAG